jgi:Carboxypeptidase regulatory-like domain/TonB-dependent Receptor Plug Domain
MRNRSLVLLFLVLGSAARISGQTISGQVSGTVFDASGAVVPEAQIAIRNTGTGNIERTSTNENGYFVFTDLLPGTYELEVERQGFQRFIESKIMLSANGKLTVNARLAPGVSSEIVQVTAPVNRVDTSSGEISAVITQRQVTGLSLNGRNYIQLLQLIPGVTVDYTSSFNSITTVSEQHVNGLRGNTSGLMVDGSYNLDVGSNGTHLVNPSIDSIQEVKVSTNSYSAEYGHAQGAQINLVTRSGSRAFHGGAFEFLRNDKLDANDWISNRSGLGKRPLRFHDYGGYLGGPIFVPGHWNTDRSKAFFFFSASFRHNTLGTARTGNVPTAEERQGDFRNSSLAVPLDSRTRQPLNPENPRVLPSSLFSKNGPPLLEPYPLPNTTGPGFNFITQTIASNPQEEQLLRVDYNLSDRTQMFFRWIRDLFDSADQSSGSALGMVGNTNRRNGTQISLNLSHTFSPVMVNVLNFSLSGNRIDNFPVVDNFTREGLGLTYPKLFPSNRYQAGPDVSIQGLTGYGIGANLQNFQWMFVWRDDLTYVRGNHAMKFGVWIERYRKNANVLQSGPRDNGSVNFATSSALSSGNPIADVLLGNFQNYGESSADSVVFTRYTQIEAYAQDNWRVRPNFSVEYGVRYVISPAIYSALNNVIAFRPELYDPSQRPRFNSDGSLTPGVGDFIGEFYVNGLSLPGEGWPKGATGRVAAASDPAYDRLFRGVPRGSYETRYNNFAPRISIAWDPTGAGNWSIRAGGGFAYDRIRNGSTILTGLGVPFLQRTTIFDANLDLPTAGRVGPILPSAVTSWSPVVKTPAVYSYSVGFQRQLPAAMFGEVRYVGTLARYITMGTDLNELPLGTRLIPGNGSLPRDSLRPFPGFGAITWLTAQGSSNYHGLQTSLERRLESGLRFGTAYTWSKVITNATSEQSIGGVQNSYDLRAERGLADFDRTHVLVMNYNWELPFFARRGDWLGKTLGGWELAGINNFTSGLNFTPSFSLAGDPTGTGKTSIRPDLVSPIRTLDPRQVQTFTLPNGRAITGNFFFDPSVSFRLPAPGRYGNSAPSVIRGPGMNNWDLSLFKNIPIREQLRMQFRAEVFNFFNHVSFSAIGVGLPATATNTTFGQVIAVAPARTLQFGMKLEF